jgi:hypothetical protein
MRSVYGSGHKKTPQRHIKKVAVRGFVEFCGVTCIREFDIAAGMAHGMMA